VTVRRIGKKWTVDFRFQHADGRVERVRKLSPVQSKAGAQEFERQRRAAMLSPTSLTRKEVPTLSAFVPTFMKIAEARNKPSEVASKRSVFEHHLLPAFGHRRLDEIGYAQIQDYAAALAENAHGASAAARRRKEARAHRGGPGDRVAAGAEARVRLPLVRGG
jgi:hypothetical protein